MSAELPASEDLSRGMPLPKAVASAVLADRLGGLTYPQIAEKHSIHHGTARRVCKRAVKNGQVTLQQIGASSRFGKPAIPAMPKEEYDRRWVARVKSKCVVDANGCWIWRGFIGYKGYGQTSYRNGNPSVHRKMYEVVHNVDLPTEQFVCHRCDVRACCNPEHLFLGDNDANMADKTAKGRHHELRVKQCPRGHAYDKENTYYTPSGARACKICSRARGRIKAGWPHELAYSTKRVPSGYTWEALCQK